MDLDEIGVNFSRVMVAFLQQHLQSAKAALARNEQTENVKNMQIYAETFKKQRKLKRVNKRSDRELASCRM